MNNEAIQAVIDYQTARINAAANMTPEILAQLEAMLAKIVAALESKDNDWYLINNIYANPAPGKVAAAALRAIAPEMRG